MKESVIMKILKFKKKNKELYQLTLDNGEVLDLYEDVVVSEMLVAKKEISKEEIREIIKKNNNAEVYSKALSYILVRIRSKFEIEEYLKKKKYSEPIITSTITRLTKEGLLNDEQFVKCFINDKLLLTNYGPYKIKNELLKHKINENIIDKYINSIDKEELDEKIDKIINKYIKANKKYSNYILKNKLREYLINLGYSNNMFMDRIDYIDNNEEDLIKKEVIKEYNKLSKKYKDKELILKIKQKLFQKGFTNINVEDLIGKYC